jgi:NCAIR mutase (PurE)-related protein
MSGYDFLLDGGRETRIGLPEAVYCAGKTAAQIGAIIEAATGPMLLTRLDAAKHAALGWGPDRLHYDPLSGTAILGAARPIVGAARVAVVTAGTSDVGVALEAMRTLAFSGFAASSINDVGVAGLWRLLRRVDELSRFAVVIVAAGMDAALPSVVAGLVPGAVIAVPTSVGYGVASGGRAALDAVLSSCAPGVTVVNIDNGYGAACAAIRILRSSQHGTS